MLRFSTPLVALVALSGGVAQAVPFQPAGLLPGDSYHLMFVTSGTTTLTPDTSVPPVFPGEWGGLDAADWMVAYFAWAGGLIGENEWDFYTSAGWQAVLSDSGLSTATPPPPHLPNSAQDRLTIAGPIYDTVGQLIATDKADLFDGTIGALMNHDEYGNIITGTTDVWTGTGSSGFWSGESCGCWDTASSGQNGAIGRTSFSNSNWILTNFKSCNSQARLYGISPLFTVPQPGDRDGDFDVDGADFLIWQRSAHDPNELIDWQTHYGAVANLPPTVAVPEPTGIALGLFSALALCVAIRRP